MNISGTNTLACLKKISDSVDSNNNIKYVQLMRIDSRILAYFIYLRIIMLVVCDIVLTI
jgi:hypothetical protein